jgi:O-antigen ligase
MIYLSTAAFWGLSLGLITSVSLLGIHQILLTIPAIYFLYLTVKERPFVPSVSSKLLLGFLVCCLLSLVVNFEHVEVPSKSFGKLKFPFYALAGISVLFYWIPKVKPLHLKFVIHTFFFSIIAAGSLALYQAVTIGGRSEGFIGIMRYGYASGMISVILLGVILQHKKLNLDINFNIATTAFFFSLLGVFLTQTRGALAGFMAAIPFVLYFYKPKLGIVFGIFSAVLISIIAYAYLFGTGTYQSRYLKSRNELGDVVRREQWQSAIIATREHPILGWGYNNFYSQVERIKKENNMQTTFYVNEHSHNTFLEVAAGTGLLGAAFFILWIMAWAIECFNFNQALRGTFIPFGVCMVISGQFEVILDTNNSILLFFMYSLSQFTLVKQMVISQNA